MTDNRKAMLIQRMFNQHGGSIARMADAAKKAEAEARQSPVIDLDAIQSSDIDQRAAAGIAQAGPRVRAIFDWNDDLVDRGTHSRRTPVVNIELESGATITIGPIREGRNVTIGTPDGHRQRLHPSAGETSKAWRRLQATSMTTLLGHEPTIRIEPDGTMLGRLRRIWTPKTRPPGALDHLAEAVANRLAERAPASTKSKTYLSDSSAITGWKNGKPNIQTFTSDWLDIGGDVRILRSGGYAMGGVGTGWVDHDAYMVAHPDWGVATVPARPILEALDTRRRRALDASLPAPIENGFGKEITGNATAMRIQSICRQALKKDPDLASSDGGRIDALANEHLPRLIARYDEAARGTPTTEIHAIDAQLAEGLEIVRRSVEDALSTGASDAREAFLTEIRFLGLRHPSATIDHTTYAASGQHDRDDDRRQA